jgi:hypothetical protein
MEQVLPAVPADVTLIDGVTVVPLPAMHTSRS